MTVFSNTTPLISLASVEALHLLPALFGRVHVAEAVFEECLAGGPIHVPDLRSLSWVELVPFGQTQARPELWQLDYGERQTLELALALKADWVILDERMGRNEAEHLGLRVTGTLGVLLKAKQRGLIASFRDKAEAMRAQGVRFNSSLVARLAREAGES